VTVISTQEESPTRTTLEIEVPAEEVNRAFDSVTRAFAKRAAIPGFRKGHAPDGIVQKKYSGEIRDEVLERMVSAALGSAIEERKLAVLGRPRIDEVKWEPPGPLRFSARLDVKPSIDVGDFGGIPVEDVRVEPTEEELNRVLDRLREAHAEFHPIEGRAAAPGDYAVADVAGTFVQILEPGQEPRTFRDEKLTLEVGHADSMPEINDALRGMAPGGKSRFRKTFPDDFPNEEFRGKTVDYELTLAALKEKRLPPANDELARLVSPEETLEGLKASIRTRLRLEKEADRRRKFRRAILDVLISRTSVPAPDVLVESETVSALRDYARYLAANDIDPKEADWEKLRTEAQPGAERRVREYLILDAIARREGIEVTETEIEAEFKRAAARRGADPAALREQMARADGLEALGEELRLSKALDRLIASAKVLPSGEPVSVPGGGS
jgi:trigger factor